MKITALTWAPLDHAAMKMTLHLFHTEEKKNCPCLIFKH